MERLEKIVSNSIFALLCLLTILLIFEDQVVIPLWLQPIGRMHPMILHFPIGFIFLLVLANLFKTQLPEDAFNKVNKFLLLLTGLTTALTAVMGFFLSKEEGYTSDVMTIHKWIGVGVSYLMYILILVELKKQVYRMTLYISFVGIVIAGHFGAGLTHGINFLTEPIFAQDVKEIDEQEPVVSSMIMPVLESKCINCHNAEKHKGDLDLSSLEKIHEGGKNGPVWIAGNTDSSHIITRAMLPLDHKKHMPPKGKPQLSEIELQLISEWIKSGADESVTLAQLNKKDTLYLLAQRILNDRMKSDEPKYDFDFADEDVIAEMNNPYRTVVQQAPNSPAIDVKIFGRQSFKMEYLTDLNRIREQVVTLDLSYLPLGDEVFEIVSGFNNLEELILNFTDITGEGISTLNRCENLRSLSLSGTRITRTGLEQLEIASLEEVFLWNTAVAEADVEQLSAKNVNLISGFEPDESEKLPLTEPLLQNGKKIITKEDPVVLTHKINGAEIRFTDDGSKPDSASRIFSEPLYYDSDVTIRAMAFKEGWVPSDTVTFDLIQRGESPKEIELLYPTEGIYKGKGKLTLIDDEVGNIRDLPYFSWIGFFHTPFGVLADMGEQPPVLSTIAFNYGIDQRTRAAVPGKVELWGGNTKEDLKLLARESLRYDQEKFKNRTSHMHNFKLVNSVYRYYKIMAYPLEKLPEWHGQKGMGGAVFVDQIFFYKRPVSEDIKKDKLIAEGSNNLN